MASINKRVINGVARFDVRFRDPEGKQRTKTFKRMTDARAFAHTTERDKLHGTYIDIDAGRETFKTYADRWLKLTKNDPQTYEIRERILRLHVYPTIGDIELRKITSTTLRTLISKLDVADGYAVDIFGLVASILASAVDDNVIANNPARSASLRKSKPRAPKRKIVPWSKAWVDAMHDALPDRYKMVVTLAAGLGLRQGEVFGLAVEDVDFLRNVVYVRRQVKLVPGKRQTFAPAKARKDDDAPREVPLPESVKQELAAHLKRYPAPKVTLPWKHDEGKPVTVKLIVTTRVLHACDRNKFNGGPWATARRKAEIPASRENGMHALRHWYASTLLESGISIRAVAEYLGHSDPAFTLRTYTHLMPSGEERTRSAVDAAFAKTSENDNSSTGASDRAAES